MIEQLSWKNIFNTNHKLYGDISVAAAKAIECGYKYMSWNGWIYVLDKFEENLDTKICLETELSS